MKNQHLLPGLLDLPSNHLESSLQFFVAINLY